MHCIYLAFVENKSPNIMPNLKKIYTEAYQQSRLPKNNQFSLEVDSKRRIGIQNGK